MAIKKIGRFNILGRLGEGAQGVVLRAEDESLRRPVAIKVLRDKAGSEAVDQLSMEAQIVSQIQHPNVLTLFEMGSYKQWPYLVFELVEGDTLRDQLRRAGAMSLTDAVVCMSQVLGGVAAAHQRGIIHRDLSSGNVLLTPEGTPKVMDFGLSNWLDNLKQDRRPVQGTLRYIAPELFAGEESTSRSDVFSLGAMFFEILTGRYCFDGENRALIANDIMRADRRSILNALEGIPESVLSVIETALEIAPKRRFADAKAMKAALDLFRVPRHGEEKAEEIHATVNFLLRHMQHQGGFSALSGHISKVLEVTSDDSQASASELVNLLAKDPMLVQRVLTLANSVTQFGAEITNVSRAVVSLGVKRVRMCVTNALLEGAFEKPTEVLIRAMISSFLAALIARALCVSQWRKLREDAFIAAMFHDLGRTLTIHYLPHEFQAIHDEAERIENEFHVARKVLGVAFHDLGIGVARHWQLPESLIGTMAALPRAPRVPERDEEMLSLVAAFSAQLARVLIEPEPYGGRDAAKRLLDVGQPLFDLDSGGWPGLFEQCVPMVEQYAIVVAGRTRSGKITTRLKAVLAALDVPADDLDPDSRAA